MGFSIGQGLGGFEIWIFLAVIAITVFILVFSFKYIHENPIKWMLMSCIVSTAAYSGFGIAYGSVSNDYLIYYALFIAAFALPFCSFRKNVKIKVPNDNISKLDLYLLNNYSLLKRLSIVYIIAMFIPTVYPEFKLFQPLLIRDEYWETMASYKSNIVISIVDTVSMFIRPFFFAYLICYKYKNPKGIKHISLFVLVILLQFIRLHYLGRNSLVTIFVELFILMFCITGFKVELKFKHVLILVAVVLLSVPFLFTYKSLVNGFGTDFIDSNFGVMAGLLIDQEFFYPTYYDQILSNSTVSQNPLDFILYVIFLPIPSILFPWKPTLHVADSFTYAITGLTRGDVGFSILLPSILGESFQFFGREFCWVFALISGYVVCVVTKYLCKHKTFCFYVWFMIIQAFTYGRGGTSALLPVLVNGTIGVFIFDFLIKERNNHIN